MPADKTTAQGTAGSRYARRRSGLAAPFAALLAAAAIAAAGCGGGSGGSSPAASSSAGIPQNNPQAFGWLRASPAPHAWQTTRLPNAEASLAFPSGWRSIRSDPGTVSAARKGSDGDILGYLNATPRQGTESLENWASFRPDHNRDEGDVDLRPIAAATDLPFRSGHGSCLIDDYRTSSGQAYREIACIVDGSNATTVVIGAAPPDRWDRQGPVIERAISSFLT